MCMVPSVDTEALQRAQERGQELLSELHRKYPELRAHLVLASQSEQVDAGTPLRDLVPVAPFLFVATDGLAEARELHGYLEKAHESVERQRSRRRGSHTKGHDEALELALEEEHDLEGRYLAVLPRLSIVAMTRIELRFDDLRYALVGALQRDPLVDRELTRRCASSIRIVLGTIEALSTAKMGDHRDDCQGLKCP